MQANQRANSSRGLSLRNLEGDRTSSFPRRIWPTTAVTGMPRALCQIRTATRICISAIRRPKSRAIRLCLSNYGQCNLVYNCVGGIRSTVAGWCARCIAMHSTTAPALVDLHGLACLRGRVILSSRSILFDMGIKKPQTYPFAAIPNLKFSKLARTGDPKANRPNDKGRERPVNRSE